MTYRELLDKRMLILSGKGGVGKSVLAATLAWIAGREGKRTLLVELDTVETLPRIYGVAHTGESYTPYCLADNISCLHVDGVSGLQEYLEMVLKSKRFARRIFRNPIYQYFVNIAPGLKELMAVGKLWDLEQKSDPGSGRPLYDLIIVDTPATGHTVSYLQMPMTAAKTVKRGFVNREAQKVVELLRDPAKTSFNIVTTLAEMPVNESMDLHEKAIRVLELPMGCIFINQAFPPFFDGPDLKAYEAWKEAVEQEARASAESRGAMLAEEQTILACAESWRRRRAAQSFQRDRLRKALPFSTVALPLIDGARDGLEIVKRLAEVVVNGQGTEER